MKEVNVIYYSDLVNDDFARNNIETKELPENYKYVNKNIFFRFFEFVIYELIVRPVIFFYIKIKYKQKFVNKKAMKGFKRKGFFLYINHTNEDLDAFVPNMIAFPNKAFIIVHRDAFSIKGIGTLVKMLGGVPIPSTRSEYKNFLDAVNYRVDSNKVLVIYPEAHIWPYYTDIRPFKNVSFNYAYGKDKPIFSISNVYIKRKEGKRPKVLSYINGPFYIDNSLPRQAAIEKIRNEVYESMKKETLKHEKYEYKYRYVKADETNVSENEVSN